MRGITYSLLVPTEAGRRHHHGESQLLISTLKGGAEAVFVSRGCQLFHFLPCAKAGFGFESSAPVSLYLETLSHLGQCSGGVL